MSTRVSTAGMHNAAIAQILARQAVLSKTQQQVASGKRVQTPADDPVAATRILDLERARAQTTQFGKNAVLAESRLQASEQALADTGTLLQRVRELTLRANSASNDDTSLRSIATELQARSKELLDLANRRDAVGEFLFAGFSIGATPFARGTTDVTYAGDQGVRNVQIGPDQSVAVGFSGNRVFMDIPEGNGTFTTAAGVHTGTGSIDPGQVLDPAAWVADTYTVRFNTPADTWDVLDSTSTVIASGAYVDGGTIAFNGVQVTVTGQPAAGDTFEIAPAGSKSIFSAIDDLIAGLVAGSSSPQSRAQLNTAMAASLQQVDQSLTHVLDLRAEVGARLSAIDSAAETRDALDVELQTSLSELRDLDYAEAISRMNLQMTGLQAAQAAYTRIGQLSLFNYL